MAEERDKPRAYIMTRMRSLLEKLHTESAQIYSEYGLAENPNWINPLWLIDDRDPEPITAVEIASALKVSQPTVTQALRGLIAAGLIETAGHPTDRRKKLITLTDEGRQRIRKLEPLWFSFRKVAAELDEESGGLLDRLEGLADALERKSLKARVGDHLEENNPGTATSLREAALRHSGFAAAALMGGSLLLDVTALPLVG